MDLARMMAKQAELLKQCSPAPVIPEAEALKLPIHVERAGSGGPRLVIIHGGVQGAMGGGPRTFTKQTALGEMGWQVEIVARPGFGESPTRGVDDVEVAAPWIADMLGDGAHLMGHSWGGAAVLLAAARRPEAVRSLILVEPALQALALTDPKLQADPAGLAEVFGMVESWMQGDTPLEYARTILRNLGATVGEMSRRVEEMDDATLTHMGCAMLQNRMPPPPVLRAAAEAVKAAKIRVLVINGAWNASVTAACDVTARGTGGEQVVVRSPNHYPQFENAQEFNQVVDAFLRSAETAQGRASTNGKP